MVTTRKQQRELDSQLLPSTIHHKPFAEANGARHALDAFSSPSAGSSSSASVSASLPQSLLKDKRFVLCMVVLLFLCYAGCIYLFFQRFPTLEEKLSFPRDLEQAKNLDRALQKIKSEYYFDVLTLFILIYIFMQSFTIPGSIFLSFLSGALFPLYIALPVVCFCSATGASVCYLLSKTLGRELVQRMIPERIAAWRTQVDKQRDHLLNYMLFVRLSPIPNWFINISSPLIDVPLSTFYLGTFLGVGPASFVCVSAGQVLQDLTENPLTFGKMVLFGLLALAALIPVYLRKRMESKTDAKDI